MPLLGAEKAIPPLPGVPVFLPLPVPTPKIRQTREGGGGKHIHMLKESLQTRPAGQGLKLPASPGREADLQVNSLCCPQQLQAIPITQPLLPLRGMRPSGKPTTTQQQFPGSRMPSPFTLHKVGGWGGAQGPTSGQKPLHPTHPRSRPRPKRLHASNVCTCLRPLTLPSHHKEKCGVTGCLWPLLRSWSRGEGSSGDADRLHFLSGLSLVPTPPLTPSAAQLLESSGDGGWLSDGGREPRPSESQLRNKKATLVCGS